MADYFFREIAVADAEALHAFMKIIAAEPHNMISYSTAEEYTRSVEEQRKLLHTYVESPVQFWLVALTTDTHEFMGYVNCRPVGLRGHQYTLSMGITLAQGWRNQGIGTQLLQRCIDWCRANPRVYRLELNVFAHNARGIHLYEKLGFVQEGVRRKAFFKHGEFLDDIIMGMLFERPTLPE